MGYDMDDGKRLELEALNDTVVRLGREYGIPTPLNVAIYAALKTYIDGTPPMPCSALMPPNAYADWTGSPL